MSTYFKDCVEEIKKYYPHPAEQFVVLSIEGHRDAANRLISYYAVKYRSNVKALFDDFASGKKHGFGTEDEIQVEEELWAELLNKPSRLYTSSMTFEEAAEVCNRYSSLINEQIEAAREKFMDLRYQLDLKEYQALPKDEKDEEDRLIDETCALEDKIKILSLFLNAIEFLSPFNNKEPDASATAIPSGRCVVM